MALDVNLALDLTLQRVSHGLVKLHKDLNGELGADGPAGHEFVKRLGEAGADGGPPVQLEGGHPQRGSGRGRIGGRGRLPWDLLEQRRRRGARNLGRGEEEFEIWVIIYGDAEGQRGI